MQTTLEIDDTLLHKAMQGEREATESAVVDAALRLYIQMRSQASLRELRGKVQWEGDLEELRRTRFVD